MTYGCVCADEAYMIPPTLGLDINTKHAHLQTLTKQGKKRQDERPVCTKYSNLKLGLKLFLKVIILDV